MTWAARADALIREIDMTIPAKATLAQRRKAMREKAYWFHGGTSWGRRVWAIRVRRYLEQHGQEPKHGKVRLREMMQPSKQEIKLAKPDIIFPYRDAK